MALSLSPLHTTLIVITLLFTSDVIDVSSKHHWASSHPLPGEDCTNLYTFDFQLRQ